ncbi:MAG TPA: response regulator transcription factor [Phycisphaerales bacterium]|nr:response regulator transcription factor [Phycisphaerales bacterium]
MTALSPTQTRNLSSTRRHVLIVEDEPDIASLIQFHLTREGFQAQIATTGRAALKMVEQAKPDLIVLDIMLPDLDGLDVCRKLKRDPATGTIPILMVSARGEESDIVVGLELGAEDYVTKPFSPRVLVARAKAVLRRREVAAGSTLTLSGGAIAIDHARHIVTVDGKALDLTLTQYNLLHFLAVRPGFVRTRDQIVSAVRGDGTVLSSRAIDVHVAALRQRLGSYGEVIETVRGVGYRVSDDRPATEG